MKSLTLHGHAGPNGWKVVIILEELKVPYQIKIWATSDQKKPPFTTELNPNGFTPVIEDPNTGVKIWESGAIITYLLELYDNDNQLTFPRSSIKEHALSQQYQWFQATFQGPNLSAALRFSRFTPNPEARSRFVGESVRILEVLEEELQRSGTGWLVGGKCSAADLAFIPYTWSMGVILGSNNPEISTYPHVQAWIAKLNDRTAVKKAKRDRDAALLALS